MCFILCGKFIIYQRENCNDQVLLGEGELPFENCLHAHPYF